MFASSFVSRGSLSFRPFHWSNVLVGEVLDGEDLAVGSLGMRDVAVAVFNSGELSHREWWFFFQGTWRT